jgi:hypothetical protein
MSTRFEKRIIMPRGAMGPTTLLGLPREDLASVERWHRREWDEFREELKAYKLRVLEAGRTAYLRARYCPKCRARRQRVYDAMMRFPKHVLMAPIPAMGRARLAAAAADCSYTASTVPNLNEFNVEPTNSYTQARLHSDGDWYHSANTSQSFGASQGTWDGDCAIADYDSRWVQNTGDIENSTVTTSTDGTWHAATTSAAVGYQVTTLGLLSGTFDLELRDGTSLNVLFTDAFSMNCEVDARN